MAMAWLPFAVSETKAELGSNPLPTATATLWAPTCPEFAVMPPLVCLMSPLTETVTLCPSLGAAHAAGAAATPSASSGAPALTANKDFFTEIAPFSLCRAAAESLVATTVCLLTLVTVVAPNDRSVGLCESSVKTIRPRPLPATSATDARQHRGTAGRPTWRYHRRGPARG